MRRNKLWPSHRTGKNLQADPPKETEETRNTKKDWSAQRSRFITRIFQALNTLYPGRYCDLEGDIGVAMFDDGRYSWVQFTAPVFAAVMVAYEGQAQVPKILTALMHLCEIMRYLPAKNEYYSLLEARKDIRVHTTAPGSDPTTAPHSPVSLDSVDAARGAETAAAIEEVAIELDYYGEMLSEAVIRRREESDAAFEAYQKELDYKEMRHHLEWRLELWEVDQMEQGLELHVIDAVKDRNIAELDVSIAPPVGVRGTVRDRDATTATATDIFAEMNASDHQEMVSGAKERSTTKGSPTASAVCDDVERDGSIDETVVDSSDADNTDAQMATTAVCPTKPYAGRVPQRPSAVILRRWPQRTTRACWSSIRVRSNGSECTQTRLWRRRGWTCPNGCAKRNTKR